MDRIARPRAFLVAPDSFKGTFSAPEVAGAMARGLERAGGSADLCPLADGGEGTMRALLAALGGEPVAAPGHDPAGHEIEAEFGWVSSELAIVEAASASGLGLVAREERDAEAASSRGTGELIAAAVERGARRVLVAVGGTATTDGGSGAVAAIRAAGGLGAAALEVLCDVRTAWEDAASVFAPQKGADEAAVRRLEARLDAFAAELPRDPRGVPMTGAGGGLSGGLWAAFGARLRPGAPAVMDAVGFDERLARVEAVISGEGKLDDQTLEGKLVGEVARRCQERGVPLHVIVGQNALGRANRERLGGGQVTEASTLASIEAAAERVAGAAG